MSEVRFAIFVDGQARLVSLDDLRSWLGLPSISAALTAEGQLRDRSLTAVTDVMSRYAEEGRASLAVVNDVARDGRALTDSALALLDDASALQRQRDRDLATLSEALLRLDTEADRTRQVLRDAGITVDPVAGTVHIFGIDQVADRTSTVEIGLAAAQATLTLSATVDYVNNQISAAQIAPGQQVDLSGILSRLSSAELAINGFSATLALKADATTLTALSGVVTSLSQTFDALSGTIATLATSTTVTAIDTRVSAVETAITTLGSTVGIARDIRQARYAADGAAVSSLAGLLSADEAARRTLVAEAAVREELFTKITDGDSAEATERLQLAVRMGTAEAAIASEQTARVSQTDALTRVQQSQAATISGQTASISTLTEAVINPAGGSAKAVMALDVNGRVSGTVQTNNGTLSTFDVAADRFAVVNPVTGAVMFRVDADGAIVATLKANAVIADNLAPGSVLRTFVYKTSSAIDIPAG